MSLKNLGMGLIIAGVTGLAGAIFLAFLPVPETAARPLQILALEISAGAILSGAWLRRSEAAAESRPGDRIGSLAVRIRDLPVFIWVFLGFLFVYVSLFVAPVFLGSGRQMNYLTGYIPNLNPIGNDLTVMVEQIKGWAAGGQSPYTVQFYPPLTYVLFAPLLLIQDPLALYRFFTLFTFLSYCLLTLVLPLKVLDRKYLPLVLLFFVTGLFSYGFQFELERGQYNVLTFLLCLTSIYIFHDQPKYRLLAYVLFSLSVQLKLYPAIFIVMFVDDWRDWKNIIRRFAGIGLLNLLLFFVMGYQTFWDFLRSVTAQVVNPGWIGIWNHSISSYISMVKQDGLGLIGPENLRAFRHNEGQAEALLLLAYAVLFLSNLFVAYRRKKGGPDPYLLLACTIGALTLPISYDYTLSILTVPVLLLCASLEMQRTYRSISIFLIAGISAAYFTVLTPYIYRPYFLNNSFPLLLFILILATLMNVLRYMNDRAQPVQPGPVLSSGTQA